MPNSALGLPSWARLLRSAQRSDSSIESRACCSVAGHGVHSSKIITMSESSARWIRIDSSGPRNTCEPSTGDANHTPSGVIRRRCASDQTWKPPESVRIGRSQRMKPCRPPCAAITSVPGRRNRWKVLPSTISAPSARSASGVIALTVP